MKRITEAEINTIDPSQYRSFLVFKRGADGGATGPETQVIPAFGGPGTVAHTGHVEQLLIDVEDPANPSVASRVREALRARAKELATTIRS